MPANGIVDLNKNAANGKYKKSENQKHCSYSEVITEILKNMKHHAKRAYIIFWHELSMDPAVRRSPYSPPVENEVQITWDDAFTIRRRRIFFLVIHLLSMQALYYCFTGQVNIYTLLFSMCLGSMASIGATAGAHRLWSHRAYKAKLPLRLILIIFQTLSVQYSALNWCRDHRLHHKYTDTDGDPHNSSRGFFFCHIGWSVILPHPKVDEKLKTIDVKDLEQDPIIFFQYKFYFPMVLVISYIIPTIIPWYFWNENIWIAHLVCAQLRHVLTLHGTFLINSAAHMWGTRPYDKNINPTENMLVSAATFGDGWHNYHHVFPWDYKNAELLDYKLNLSTLFIDFFSLFGWAYDLKTVDSKIVAKRANRTGDGSHHSLHSTNVYGWNDKDMTSDERESTIILK